VKLQDSKIFLLTWYIYLFEVTAVLCFGEYLPLRGRNKILKNRTVISLMQYDETGQIFENLNTTEIHEI
jgi:hypothetical protein